MSDFHEQDTWDQEEVEIIDLGAPDKGFSRYFFTLGEKWHAAASLRVKLVALVGALSLLIAVLQPGSSFMNNQTPGAPHTVPTYPLLHTIYTIGCATAISITPDQSITFTWHQILSTPSAQGCIFSSGPGSHCSSWQVLSTSSTQCIWCGDAFANTIRQESVRDYAPPACWCDSDGKSTTYHITDESALI